MTFSTFRTSNRHSMKFRMRMFARRTRTRVVTEVVRFLDVQNNTRAAA